MNVKKRFLQDILGTDTIPTSYDYFVNNPSLIGLKLKFYFRNIFIGFFNFSFQVFFI